MKTKEQRHREDLERLKSFRPIDDTFMRGLFKNNLPLAQFVLRIITDKPDLVLTSCDIQADLKRVTGAKSVCLDAYATDSTGKKYDLEIQRADIGANPYRARYHSSILDIENLDEGHDFSELPETYIIFITEDDYYKAGKPVYVVQHINVTLNQPFNDGTHILYVNGQYRGNTAIGKLMHDFNCADADDMNYKILADKTRYLKENQKGVSEMCKAMEDLRTESFAEGKAEGIAQGIAHGISQGLSQGKLDTIKIFLNNTHDAMLVASSLAEPLDYIEKIARDNNITLK